MLSLCEDYSFLLNYFKSGIINSSDERKISHCILFYGNDINAQYALALEIARMLNCKEGAKDDCDCLNCKWIRENKHPAVITVSRFDFKPDDDETKTVISVRQTQELRSMLMLSSDYHRVIIFCDKDNEGNLQGLNYKVFQEEAANSLLKTFEEPSKNTTFIILTKDKTDMISTIISRSQCFWVPAKQLEEVDTSIANDLIDLYLSQNSDDVLQFQNKFATMAKDIAPDVILNSFQNGLLSVLKGNISNKTSCTKFQKDIKSIEKAKLQLALNMSAKNVAECLAYEIFNIT